MLQLLKTLEPFADLDAATLQTVAQHARLIDLPAGRWVQAPGKCLRGCYFLVRGRLKVMASSGLLVASAQPLQLDPGGVITASTVQLLRLDLEPIAFLFGQDEAHSLPVAQPQSDLHSWQTRFLQSHMLSPLPAALWQQILGHLTPIDCRPGEQLINEGDTASECFIMAAGQARVLRAGVTLRQLGPGDFFGEDALLSCAPRNASVRMLTAGRVMLLQQADFRRWLADVLVAGAGLDSLGVNNQCCVVHQVGDVRSLRTELAALDPCLRYHISGPLPVARLAVFLLRQRGIHAELETAGTGGLRQALCDPLPSFSTR